MIFIDGGLRFKKMVSISTDLQSIRMNGFLICKNMYYLGYHMNALSSHCANKRSRPIKKEIIAVVAATTVVKRFHHHPFLNGAYEIESIPMKPLINTKGSPFYSRSIENLYETSEIEQKYVYFNVKKLLDNKTSPDFQTNNSTRHCTFN